jgi:hypothetical protein
MHHLQQSGYHIAAIGNILMLATSQQGALGQQLNEKLQRLCAERCTAEILHAREHHLALQ